MLPSKSKSTKSNKSGVRVHGFPLDAVALPGRLGGARETPTFFFFITLGLEVSDTNVYEPQIQALLGTASHYCEAVVLGGLQLDAVALPGRLGGACETPTRAVGCSV